MTDAVAMEFPKLTLSFLCSCMLFGLSNSQEEQFAGPLRIVVHQIDECDESGTRQVYMTSTRINKVSRNKYLYSTNVTLEVTVDDNTEGELDIAKFGNGGWRPHFMQIEIPHFCTSLKKAVPVYFNAIMRALNTECPILPGTYQLKDLDLGYFKIGPSFPMFPYGKYRGDYYGSINGTLIGCIRYYLDVVPKRSGRKPTKTKKKS